MPAARNTLVVGGPPGSAELHDAELSPDRRARRVRRAPAVMPRSPWWRRCVDATAGVAVVVGALWFLMAPGGALAGNTDDFNSWFARDAVLGMLLSSAGIVTAVQAMLARRKNRTGAPGRQENSWAFAAILALAAMAGAVLAWRVGVFAGDLFQRPPANMANPSMVFSLRSGAVLLLWPLSSMLVVFFWSMLSHSFSPAMQPAPPAKKHIS